MAIAVSIADELPRRNGLLLAFEITKCIPGVLDEGYLQILAQELSALRPYHSHQPEVQEDFGIQPLKNIYVLCWHPLILKSVMTSLAFIPTSIAQRLASHPSQTT
jgi:hypothetical protein